MAVASIDGDMHEKITVDGYESKEYQETLVTLQHFLEGDIVDSEPSTDKWGGYFSAYAPYQYLRIVG